MSCTDLTQGRTRASRYACRVAYSILKFTLILVLSVLRLFPTEGRNTGYFLTLRGGGSHREHRDIGKTKKGTIMIPYTESDSHCDWSTVTELRNISRDAGMYEYLFIATSGKDDLFQSSVPSSVCSREFYQRPAETPVARKMQLPPPYTNCLLMRCLVWSSNNSMFF